MKKKKKQLFGQKKSNAIFGYHLFRVPAIKISPLMIKLSMTANQATFTSFLLGIIASVLLVGASYPYFLASAIIYYLAKLFDYVDGEIARAQNIQAKIGKWGDRYGDVLKIIMPYFFLGLGMYLKTNNITYFILGLISVIFFLLFIVTRTIQMIMLNLYRYSEFQLTEKMHLGWTTPSSLLIMLFLLFNQPILMLWFFSTIGVLPWLIKIYMSYKTIKDYDKKYKLV